MNILFDTMTRLRLHDVQDTSTFLLHSLKKGAKKATENVRKLVTIILQYEEKSSETVGVMLYLISQDSKNPKHT
jgi:hypothetical protein